MKKIHYIIIGVGAVLILGSVAFFAYKNNIFPFNSGAGLIKKDPQKLIYLDPRLPNIPVEVLAEYQLRFNNIKKSLESDKENMDAWLGLGILQKGVGDYEAARDTWLYVNQIRPKNSISFANLADLYAYYLDNPGEAEIMIHIAIENDPGDVNYVMALADLYRYKLPGKEKLFEKTLLEAEKKFPKNVNIISVLASYYRQEKRVDEAIAYYEELLALDPSNLTAKQDLAELKAQQ